MIEVIELKSTGENSENFLSDNENKCDKTGVDSDWYRNFPGYRNFTSFEPNSKWNRLVFQFEVGDDTLDILKALGKFWKSKVNKIAFLFFLPWK